MSFNLIRNSRVFFTTNLETDGSVKTSGFLPANTREIQVLDGFSFSQNTTQDTVTLNEAGAVPARGQRSFNTALEPVDFSMSTYMRPADGGTNITCEESVLWNAMFATDAIGGTAPAWSEATDKATLVATNSQTHQLQRFGLIIVVDGVTYTIDNCVLDTATIDFGLDAIAMIAWAGKGSKLNQISGVTATAAVAGVVTLANGLAGTAKGKNTEAPFIANKLSTVTIDDGVNGSGNNTYTLALTGGSLTIANNVTYLMPANLGVVNRPATYFTGTRAISGSLNCYLRTGATFSAGLLANMLIGSTTDVSPAFEINIAIGGSANATKVEFEMPAAVLTIPSVTAEQVVSTTINFTAQGSAGTGNAFDIGSANELTVRYYTTNAA